MTKRSLGRKEFLFSFPQYCSPLKEIKGGTQIGRVPRGRSQCRDHGRVPFAGLFLMTYSVCFFIAPRTTSPQLALLPIGWGPSHMNK